MLILLLSKILSMSDFYSVILGFSLMPPPPMLVHSEPAVTMSQVPTHHSQSTLTLLRLWVVITFSAEDLSWSIVLQLSRLLICGPSSLVLIYA
jgi:hypothetical protein